MRTLITFSLSLFIMMNTYSQLESYNLKHFILPDYTYRANDISFDLSGNNTRYESNNSKPDFQSNYTLEDRGNIFINNIKTQKSVNYNVYTQGLFENKAKLINGYINIDYAQRFYNVKKQFFYLNPAISYYTYNNGAKLSDNSSNFVNLALPLGIGIGRIESVTAAWTAISIYRELYNESLLSRLPDEGEITDLANVIIQNNFTRAFDLRNKRKADLKNLDALIQSKGILANNSIDYYNSLVDMLFYGANTFRSAGSRLELAFVPSISYRGTSYLNDVDRQGTLFVPGIGVNYIYENPIDQKRQLSLSFRNTYNLKEQILQEKNNGLIGTPANISSNLTASFGYYPNTRSFYSVGLNVGYSNLFNKIINDEDEFSIGPVASFYYYISPRFRFEGHANYNHNPSPLYFINNLNENQINYRFGLRYSLF